MNSEEMVALFTQACSKKYDEVSPPLHREGENPLFLAVTKKTSPRQHRHFHLYEIVDQKTFLENPSKINDAFNDNDFMMSTFCHIDVSYIKENGEYVDLEPRKLIPSSMACLTQYKKMFETDQQSVEQIFFISGPEEIFGFNDLLQTCGGSNPDSKPLSREARRAQRNHK